MICRLTGTAPPHSLPTDRDMDPIDISHLWKEYPVPCMEICWMLLDITELVTHGYDRGAGDEQLFLYLDPDSIHFQSDNLRRVKQNKDPKRRRVEPPGQLDPSIDAILADVFPILEGDTGREWLALVSPTYKWQAHYINATPDSLLQRLYYDRPIADIIGGTYGDRLAIKFDVTKRLEAFSGSADAIGGPVLLGGLDSDLVLRTGMGVAFKISASAMSEAASRLSALAVLHGLIIAISDASVISVRVVLVHRNLARLAASGRGRGDRIVTRRPRHEKRCPYGSCGPKADAASRAAREPPPAKCCAQPSARWHRGMNGAFTV